MWHVKLVSYIKGLRAFEKRLLKRKFGPKMDEVTGVWRKLNSKELHNLYSSKDIIKMIESRRCSTHGGVEKFIQNFGSKA
jgi:hypothetical protein